LRNTDNAWNLSLAIEITNILGFALQIVMISFFLTIISLHIAVLNFICIFIAVSFLSHLYSKQEVFQRKIFQSGYRKQKVQVGARTLGRVRSGELGSLVNGTIMVATLIALIIFHRHGLIKTPDAVISFFAVRMISSNLNSLASGLMRHARALVNSSLSTVSVTRNSPLDESV
jgi:hypothetical protein